MDITDITGAPHFRLRSNIKSMHKRRAIYDNAGNAVSSTMQKVMSLKAVTYICPGANPQESAKIAELRKVVFSGGTPLAHVFIRGNKSSNHDILIRGTFGEREFEISTSDDRLLARVTRGISSAVQSGKDTYYLRIFPGVDTALVVTLATIIEEVMVE